MNKYLVTVIRTSNASRDIVVEANNDKEAQYKALDIAGNFVFDEQTADYAVDTSSPAPANAEVSKP